MQQRMSEFEPNNNNNNTMENVRWKKTQASWQSKGNKNVTKNEIRDSVVLAHRAFMLFVVACGVALIFVVLAVRHCPFAAVIVLPVVDIQFTIQHWHSCICIYRCRTLNFGPCFCLIFALFQFDACALCACAPIPAAQIEFFFLHSCYHRHTTLASHHFSSHPPLCIRPPIMTNTRHTIRIGKKD